MNITCPQCGTVYRLPDEKAKPGAKLRCSVCRHVFALPEAPVEAPVDEPLSLGDGPAVSPASGLEMSGLGESAVRSANGQEGRESDAGHHGFALAGEEPRESAEDDVQEGAVQGESLDMPEEKPSRFKGMFGMLLLSALVGGGIWAWQNTNYLDGLKTMVAPLTSVVESAAPKVDPQASASAPAASKVDPAIEKLELLDVAQYHVKNSKIGGLVVIEGKVRNNFTSPRELISLEAELYNAEGKVLASRRQIAGISLSSFQLEVLDKTELENTLNRKLDIITSNINVMPGAEVPFTVVFSEIPAGASDYKVRIAGASEPAPVGNLSK